MPRELAGLPLDGLDDREAASIPATKAADLRNIRVHRNELRRRPAMGALEDKYGSGRAAGETFIQASFTQGQSGFFADQMSQLLMAGDDQLYVWDPITERWAGYAWPEDPGPAFLSLARMGAYNTLNGCYFVSRVKRLMRWDGSALSVVPHDLGATPGEDPILRALTVLGFNNRVILLRTVEDTTIYGSRIRWCANGLPDVWNPANNEEAGVLEIIEGTNAPLTGGFIHGERCYLTKAETLIELIATGSASPTFRAETRAEGVGMIGPHTAASHDGVTFFLGRENVYAFDGASFRAVGDPVRDSLAPFLVGIGDVSFGQLQFARAIINARRKEYWLLMPPISPTTSTVFIYDYMNDRWFRDEFSSGLVCGLGYFRMDDATAFSGSVPHDRDHVVWAVQNKGTFLDDENANVDSAADVSQTATSGFEASVQTRDYTAKEFTGRQVRPTTGRLNTLHAVEFEGVAGARYYVGVSSDKGATWTESTVTVGEDGIGRLWLLLPFRQVRFRWRSQDDHGFILRGICAYDWKPAGRIVRAA